jgi:hypothetical protein
LRGPVGLASRRRRPCVAITLLAVFAGIVLLEHALVPQLSPATHMVSEYANSPDGALMVVALIAWAVALGLTANVVGWPAAGSRHRVSGSAMPWLLAAAAAGILITACINTQTSAGALPHGVRLAASGRLHDIGSGLATIALFGAAVSSVWAIEDPAAFRPAILVMLSVAVVGDLALLSIGEGVGGVRQRLLLLLACGWQGALLASRDPGRTPGRQVRRQPDSPALDGGGRLSE